MSLYRSPEVLTHGSRRFEKIYYESMGANDHHQVAIFEPRGMIGKVYVRLH